MNDFKKFINLLKTINPSIYAASLVYYFVLIILPISNYIIFILNKLEIDNISNAYLSRLNAFSLIIFLINLFYVSMMLVHNLKNIINKIYLIDNISEKFVEKIKSIGIMILIIFLIILFIIIELYLNYLFANILYINSFFKIIILIIFRFVIISFILSVLLKLVIPIKIKLVFTFKIGIILSLLSYLLINVYILFYKYFGTFGLQNLYGKLYQVFFLLVLVYLLCLIFIYAIIFIFFMYKQRQTNI